MMLSARSAIFIFILLSSVALKLFLQESGLVDIRDPGRDSSVLVENVQRMTDFLYDSGLDPEVVTWQGTRFAVYVEMDNGCKLSVTSVNPKGWDEAAIMQSEASGGGVRYLTRWGISDKLPVLYSALDLYFTYVLRQISEYTGYRRADAMVFAIIPKSYCDLSQIKWTDIYAQ